MTMPVIPYLTSRARTALSLAQDLADRLGHDDVTPVHIARAGAGASRRRSGGGTSRDPADP